MILTFLGINSLLRKKVSDKVEAYVYSIVLFCTVLFVITEVYSVFNFITFASLWTTWLLLALLIWSTYIRIYGTKQIADDFKGLLSDKKKVIFLGIFMAIFTALSFLTIPYNWDSMVYHLGRLYQWKINSSVNHFASVDIRELASPPMAEFIDLHVYIMSNSDRLLNILQTFSYLTTGGLVYYISLRIGASKRWSIISSIIFMTSPIAFVEAFTTQVDNYVALLMACFTYCIIPYLKVEDELRFDRNDIARTVILSMIMGLGYNAKPSIGIEIFFFATCLLVVCIKRKSSIIICIKHILTAIPVAIGMVIPEMLKNLKTFGSIMAPGIGDRQLIGSLHLKHWIVNFYKVFTFNLPTALVKNSDAAIYKIGMGLASILNIDINNPAISEDSREYMVHSAPNYGCDTAVNPIITWLFIIFVILLLIYFKRLSGYKLGLYFSVTAAISFICFCAVLRWEPFVSRYMISYFVIMAVAIGWTLSTLEKEHVFMVSLFHGIAGAIVCLCMLEMVNLSVRQIQNVTEQRELNDLSWGYFWEHTSIYDEYVNMTDYINQYDANKIGLDVGDGCYEYPFFVMLKNNAEIRRIEVNNVSSKYEKKDFHPDIILKYCVSNNGAMELNYNGAAYKAEHIEDRWSVYLNIQKVD